MDRPTTKQPTPAAWIRKPPSPRSAFNSHHKSKPTPPSSATCPTAISRSVAASTTRECSYSIGGSYDRVRHWLPHSRPPALPAHREIKSSICRTEFAHRQLANPLHLFTDATWQSAARKQFALKLPASAHNRFICNRSQRRSAHVATFCCSPHEKKCPRVDSPFVRLFQATPSHSAKQRMRVPAACHALVMRTSAPCTQKITSSAMFVA